MWTNKDEEGSQGADPLTTDELMEALQKVKNRKATGLDGINTELLKYGGPLLHLRRLHLYNGCWQESKILMEWQIAQAMSLFKKGDRSTCERSIGASAC